MESASSTTIIHGIISESDIISGYQAFNERKAVRGNPQSPRHKQAKFYYKLFLLRMRVLILPESHQKLRPCPGTPDSTLFQSSQKVSRYKRRWVIGGRIPNHETLRLSPSRISFVLSYLLKYRLLQQAY